MKRRLETKQSSSARPLRAGLSLALLILGGLALLPSTSRADAIVVNQSMKASTIAEILVEKEQIRVELEIGIVDFEGF